MVSLAGVADYAKSTGTTAKASVAQVDRNMGQILARRSTRADKMITENFDFLRLPNL